VLRNRGVLVREARAPVARNPLALGWSLEVVRTNRPQDLVVDSQSFPSTERTRELHGLRSQSRPVFLFPMSPSGQ
jgi:hypothetical protein